MNALDQALADARRNAQLNGDDLYTDNLEDIANPPQNSPAPIGDYVDSIRTSAIPEKFINKYDEFMQGQYQDIASKGVYAANNPEQDGLLLSSIKDVYKHVDGLHQRMTHLFDDINVISTTISKAAQAMPQSNLDHRSLDQWNDTQLINELVERENSLMPFYFELLKRIPQELQPHVDASMNGKYQSLAVLSKLCAALSYVQQHQTPVVEPVYVEPQKTTIPTTPLPQGHQNPYIANSFTQR